MREGGRTMSSNEQTRETLWKGLLTENLSDILARAESGDVLAAREALPQLAFLLSTRNRHPRTGEPLPVPGCVRDYLAKSLDRMAGGEDANRAMNLKKAGKKKWAHFEKRLAASVLLQLREQGMTMEEAKMEAADMIRKHVSTIPCPPAWAAFQDQKIEGETLQDWYYELKEELTQMR
jgi:hypothetical protein